MSKKRLEEIVEKISEQNFDRIIVPETLVTVEYQDIKFLTNALIKQTERVQELEEDLTKYRNGFEFQLLINNSIKKQNKRYREALEFYADPNNYELKGRGTVSSLVFDGGIRARKALEGESSEEM